MILIFKADILIISEAISESTYMHWSELNSAAFYMGNHPKELPTKVRIWDGVVLIASMIRDKEKDTNNDRALDSFGLIWVSRMYQRI